MYYRETHFSFSFQTQISCCVLPQEKKLVNEINIFCWIAHLVEIGSPKNIFWGASNWVMVKFIISDVASTIIIFYTPSSATFCKKTVAHFKVLLECNTINIEIRLAWFHVFSTSQFNAKSMKKAALTKIVLILADWKTAITQEHRRNTFDQRLLLTNHAIIKTFSDDHVNYLQFWSSFQFCYWKRKFKTVNFEKSFPRREKQAGENRTSLLGEIQFPSRALRKR